MPRIDVEIPTRDGVSKGTLHVPDGAGPWPGVLIYVDVFGTRDTLLPVGDQLASMGYVALLPDIYYRDEWAPFDVRTVFTEDKERGRLFSLAGSLTNERVAADAGGYADFLLARPEVRGPVIGAHGYCMGGRLALVAAGALGDKLAAVAAFHAGRIAVPDDPSSPHLAADQMRAAVFVAGAAEDNGFTEEHATLLRDTLNAAGLPNTVEIWPGRHGFTVPDMPVYDSALTARHWDVLAALYGERLPQ